MTQLGFLEMAGTSRAPETGEERGAWCTPRKFADAVGAFDVDPFTNPRSWIRARWTCMLERGDNGLVTGTEPGWFLGRECCGAEAGSRIETALTNKTFLATREAIFATQNSLRQATAKTRVWIQPDYGFVLEAIRHYGHTRFTALLRLDTSTQWFEELFERTQVIMVPRRERIEFEPPPGVKPSSNPFPHGLFYARADDVTPEIAALCYEWPIRRNLPPMYFTTEPSR